MMGYYIGKARFARAKQDKRAFLLRGLSIAILIHGTYNFLLFSTTELTVYVGLCIFPLLIFAFVRLKKKIGSAMVEDQDTGRTRIPLY